MGCVCRNSVVRNGKVLEGLHVVVLCRLAPQCFLPVILAGTV